MKKFSLLVVTLLFSVATFAQSAWKVDPMHSFLTFSVKHLGISFVEGKFDKYEGFFSGDIKDDHIQGNFKFIIDANSINTGVDMRDEHLRSADFFDATQHGSLTFESDKIEPVGKNDYKLYGKLTIKGVSHPVVFDLKYGGYLKDDGNGLQRIGFQATTTIDRFEYKVDYDPSGKAIAKDVQLNVNLEFIQ